MDQLESTALGQTIGASIEKKLVNTLGLEKSQLLAAEVLRQIGIRRIETPDHELRFGQCLVERGGLFAFMGRSIQIQALMRGAEDPSSPRQQTLR